MPLIRGHHSFDDHYTQVPNSWLRDRRLSYRATGILAEIMSHKVGWNIGMRTLANRAKEGIDAIRSAVNELEEFGYLKRYQTREGTAFGEVIWETCDPSFPVDSPSSGFPSTGNPSSENPITKNNIIKNTKKPLAKSTTLPQEFSLSESMLTWALEKNPNVDAPMEFEKFKNWHTAKGSTMKNWEAAWRTWILNSLKYAKPEKDEVDPWAGKKRYGVGYEN